MAVMMSMYTSRDQKDWDVSLQMLAFAYLTTKQESTGYSPFFLLYGRDARLPVEVTLRMPSFGIDDPVHYKHCVSEEIS